MLAAKPDEVLAESVLEATAAKPWIRTRRVTRHLVALAFWGYIFLKLFVLDVDEVLVRQLLPGATWLVDYRGVIILGVLAIVAAVSWSLKLFGAVLYILFYPFVVACWHVPASLIKHRAWATAVALFAVTVSALRSLRWTIIFTGACATGSLLVAAGVTGVPVGIGVLLLLGCLVASYGRTIVGAFRSSLDMFSSESLDKIWSFVSKGFAPTQELKALEVDAMTETQRNMWIGNLQLSLLYGRACYFVADKLRALRQGRITAAIAAVKVAGLFALTVLVFALANLGLYKVDHAQFSVTRAVHGFDFFWYSFQASFMNGVPELTPVGDLARILYMANELTTGLILFVIVVFFVTGVQASRNADQMDSLIAKISAHAAATEGFISQEFGLTVVAAIEELTRLRAGMIGWIVAMSPGIDGDEPRRP